MIEVVAYYPRLLGQLTSIHVWIGFRGISSRFGQMVRAAAAAAAAAWAALRPVPRVEDDPLVADDADEVDEHGETVAEDDDDFRQAAGTAAASDA